MTIICLEQNTPEWHEWRKEGLGCSDVASICGLNPWGMPLEVYNSKKGLSKPTTSDAMQRGHDYEAEALNVFNRSSHMIPIFKPACAVHNDLPYFRASLDGYNEYFGQGVEIKIPGRSVMFKAKLKQIPIYYQYQIQAEMCVTESALWFYCCYDPNTFEMYTVPVLRDEKIIAHILESVTNFWENHIVPSIPPVEKSKRKRAKS